MSRVNDANEAMRSWDCQTEEHGSAFLDKFQMVARVGKNSEPVLLFNMFQLHLDIFLLSQSNFSLLKIWDVQS